MRRGYAHREHGGAIGLCAITFSNSAPCVAAECWLRDDGTEICSPEPLAWRLAWWFWFAMLVLVLASLNCGDRLCCCLGRERVTKGKDDDGEAGGVIDDKTIVVGDKALVEPLLPQLLRKANPKTKRCCESQQKHPIKPVYRYLDP